MAKVGRPSNLSLAMKKSWERRRANGSGAEKSQVPETPPRAMSYSQLRDEAINFLRVKADDHQRMHEHYICAIVDLEQEKFSNGAKK